MAMGRSDDGVVLPGGHTAGRGLASSASAAPGKVGGLEADLTTRQRKKTKTKTKNEGEEEEDDEAEGFYVGTGVDMEEDDDVGEDSFGCWSDDATTSATAKTRTAAAKAGVDAATDQSTSDQTDRVVADSSGTVEDQEETNFYGGFVGTSTAPARTRSHTHHRTRTLMNKINTQRAGVIRVRTQIRTATTTAATATAPVMSRRQTM